MDDPGLFGGSGALGAGVRWSLKAAGKVVVEGGDRNRVWDI